MSRTLASPKPQPRSSAKRESRPGLNERFQSTAELSAVVDELAKYIKQSAPYEPEICQKVLSLKENLEQRARQACMSSVKDWDDFTLRLNYLERAYKRGQFDESTRNVAKILYEFLREVDESDEQVEERPQYWKSYTLLYELNDIFHLDAGINERIAKTGKRVRRELRQLHDDWEEVAEDLTDDERKLIQDKILYCACRANELKRAGDAKGALELFEWLLNFTTKKLKSDSLPCLGMCVNLTYQLGSVYRILELHDQAEQMYTQSLDLIHKRSLLYKEDPDDHFYNLRKQAMAVGIGLGWVNLTRGFLRRAENALTTARSMLARSTDPIVPSYIELLYGTLKRCQAGTNPDKLQESIDILNRARNAFEEHEKHARKTPETHSRYIPRICWELSLALRLTKQYTEAENHLDVVAKYADRIKHPKWQTNVKILRSRILQDHGRCSEALVLANSAVDKAGECKSILPLLDAYITRGEATFYLAQKSDQQESTYAKARSDFDAALELVKTESTAELPSNPKIAAVCNLRISQCHAREGDGAKAREYFAIWELLRPVVEHEWVRELAVTVKGEIESLSRNFTISAQNSEEWDYAVNIANLRRWLLTQALRKTKKNYSEAAKLIGVKRATLYQWQEDSRSQSKRARISRNGDPYVRKDGEE